LAEFNSPVDLFGSLPGTGPGLSIGWWGAGP